MGKTLEPFVVNNVEDWDHQYDVASQDAFSREFNDVDETDVKRDSHEITVDAPCRTIQTSNKSRRSTLSLHIASNTSYIVALLVSHIQKLHTHHNDYVTLDNTMHESCGYTWNNHIR